MSPHCDRAASGSQAQLAFDRSLRSVDADGHLVVEMSRISKANICPYRGSEIPNWQALGLDPNRIYRLLRDPKELEKAAASFSGKPLLIRHVPVTADLPNQELWVGTLGTVTWEAPYLVARPLTVISAEAQRLIEADEQRELSAGYRYVAEMIPGTYGGERFDGKMTSIGGNHAALVTNGRAGPDVLVADELPPELNSMKHRTLIARLQKTIPALAALSTADLMALDAELGETPAESVVTLDAAEEKAACDAALDAKRAKDGADAELSKEEREEAIKKAKDKKAKDAALKMKGKDKKAAKDESEEEKEAEDESEKEAEDESEEEEEDDKPKAKDKKRAKDESPDHRKDFNSIKQGKDKKAQDSAMTMDQVTIVVEKAVERATAATAAKVREEVTAKQRALAIACDEVAPLVGKVQLHAFDSAEEVYAFALERVGVDVDDDFPEAGYRALVKNELRHRDTGRKPSSPSHALDKSGFDADTLFQRVN
jgi:hypothetical protein